MRGPSPLIVLPDLAHYAARILQGLVTCATESFLVGFDDDLGDWTSS
jgi:hypothetical protein